MSPVMTFGCMFSFLLVAAVGLISYFLMRGDVRRELRIEKAQKACAEQEECDSCHFPTQLTEYDCHDVRRRGQTKRLCDLCSHSMAGVVHDYPGNYPGIYPLHSIICYVGNAIIAEIQKSR